MSQKEMFIQTWEREFQTTVKVLKAYPSDKLDLKPHERSRSAKDLAWTFVGEESVVDGVCKGKVDFEGGPKAPNTLQEIISAYEKYHKENVDTGAKVPSIYGPTADEPWM
jgi:hypothetical protein